MGTETMSGGAPTLLKELLRARHWQKHATFIREWDKVARAIDPRLRGSWPRHAQFYRWLRGDLRELPYPDACRVLESMFPQYQVRDLFRPCSPEIVNQRAHNGGASSGNPPEALDHLGMAGLFNMWSKTGPDAIHDLVRRVSGASENISVFNLTGSFYATDEMLSMIESKAHEISVTFYVMNPDCDSRRDRYRLEPTEALME